MKKIIERAIYFFGLNISAYDLKHELNLLRLYLPSSFKGRDVIDVGCGDGRVSLELKKVIKPRTFRGLDLSRSLVFLARKRGLEAEVKDVEREHIEGDLGILWGVIHHFEKPEKTLSRIYKNFNSLVIRAPINNKRVCELGHKFDKSKILGVISRAGIERDECKIIESKKTESLIMFVQSS